MQLGVREGKTVVRFRDEPHLYKQISLDDFLCLSDQTLLECLDFLYHLVSPRIRAIESTPSMRVVWVFEFFR